MLPCSSVSLPFRSPYPWMKLADSFNVQVLIIFFAVLPMILVALAKFEGAVSQSAAEFSAGNRLFLFQIVNVFIGTLIAGAIFNQISAVRQRLHRKPQSARAHIHEKKT